ncbi:MAG: acetyl-CoA C-acetyltransferase [Bdellovibrionota bacterium]
MKESLVFLSGKRTPFGSYGGSLRDVNPSEIALTASTAAVNQANISPTEIDHVIFGNVLHSAADSIYSPRHIGLRCGIPESVPALGINRLCGSGFQVIVEAYQQMTAGDTKVALVGGVENMSMTPYVLRKVRWGLKMGDAKTDDMMTDSLFDTYAKAPMAITAENLLEKYGLSREQADSFALRSQTRFDQAKHAGYFADEISAITFQDAKGKPQTLDKDEHPKPETTLAVLSGLRASFKKDGTVTAGNASGIVDGAAALVVSSEAEANRRKLTPLGRMVAYGISGCDPKIMGIGPVPASRLALKRAGMSLGQMDLVEINEAFAAQTLAVQKELEIPDEILNVNGGAIAIGHPLAASGARIVQTMLYQLQRQKKRYGLCSACIGGGQGIAVIVEAFSK